MAHFFFKLLGRNVGPIALFPRATLVAPEVDAEPLAVLVIVEYRERNGELRRPAVFGPCRGAEPISFPLDLGGAAAGDLVGLGT